MLINEWKNREKNLWEEFYSRGLVEIVYYVMDGKYNHVVSAHDTYEEALEARLYHSGRHADYVAAGLNSTEVMVNE